MMHKNMTLLLNVLTFSTVVHTVLWGARYILLGTLINYGLTNKILTLTKLVATMIDTPHVACAHDYSYNSS